MNTYPGFWGLIYVSGFVKKATKKNGTDNLVEISFCTDGYKKVCKNIT